MHIKSIVAATAIALIAGVGSVSADELSVANTAADTTTQTAFAAVAQLPVTALSSAEMAMIRGAYVVDRIVSYTFVSRQGGGSTAGGVDQSADILLFIGPL